MTATQPPPITATGAPRPRFAVDVVVLDLDGTVLDQHQRLHPRTAEAIRAVIGRGVPVIVATGRMYRSALPWARTLGTTTPLICYQGAVVRDLPGPGASELDGVPLGELLVEDALDEARAGAAIEAARRGGWHRQAYLDERLLCEEDRPEAHLYSGIAQVPIHLVDDLRAAIAGRGSTKVVCVVDDEAGATACEDSMRAALGTAVRVTRSLPPFVEVTDPMASKGRAVRLLCERLGLDPGRGVGVGDAPNDVDMFESVGFAVAVRGGRDAVLRSADAVCAPPEEAGVADVLDSLGLT